ncbi:helix-turn-helix transcriptional regulator [Phycicoccus jejuensis]|uniref:helix-turn-helix transcriptional regulator n=2 Tax=Phycicoccus jejuensis TaxID=367299 RepID=UPI0004C3520A|nr:helix-turn-helix transcriptional regulator [Phycicoccus jejuensis]
MPQPPATELPGRVAEAIDQQDPVLTPLPTPAEVTQVLVGLAAQTAARVWSMQWGARLSSLRRTLGLDGPARDRAVDERTVYSPRAAASFPLLTTLEPEVRIGDVPLPALVVDERAALLASPRPLDREVHAFLTEDPDLVALAARAIADAWAHGRGWQDAGLRPPLDPRRFHVALGMADGLSDRQIAETLGVSARTVAVEVRAVLDWLGARNRGHGIAMLVGAA